ncbi:DUF6603 domain-containing protein [Streptomyces cinnamoneus]|uniref:DUF6603 domain-containing protein n=1 Tax=Streptomyces cinnamoneus TaxID=53446 RepID=UPI0033F09C7D
MGGSVDGRDAVPLVVTGGGGGKRLWALVVRAGINVGLSGLPVVGVYVPRGADMRLTSLSAEVVSGVLQSAERSKLNDVLGKVGSLRLHDGVPGRAGLGIGLSLADKPVDLWVPLGSSSPGKKSLPDPASEGLEQMAGEPVFYQASLDAVAWYPLERALGPLRLERVGARYAQGSLGVLLDAQVSAAGMTLAARGLGVVVLLKEPQTPEWCLGGLGIGFSRKPVTIVGELLNQSPPPSGYRFAVAGMAAIEVPSVTVKAVGSYAHPEAGGEPSLFLFGTLGFTGQRGIGPPQFRITKFAAGFGYNSSVREVALEEVDSFPFLTMLKSGPGVDDPGAQGLKALSDLTSGPRPYVAPRAGQVWVAAGLEFVAFEFVTAQALALVEFGSEVCAQILLHASAPFPKKPATPYGLVEIDARAGYRSGTDVFYLDATIKDSSFLLERSCRLGGDLAVRAWFGRSAHPGDFVFTVGGYHPDFAVPAHYPSARRMSIYWPTSVGVTITGEAYLALTPSAFMVGSRLNVSWEWANLAAGFDAKVNALVQWAPFHFDVEIDLNAWASVDLGFTRLEAEVSVGVRVWGPPTGGTAHFSALGFDFPIDFGEPRQTAPKPLSGQQFREQMLPHADGNKKEESVLAVRPVTGVLPAPVAKAAAAAVPQVSSRDFAVEAVSAVPATEVHLNGKDITKDKDVTGGKPYAKTLPVRPMNASGSVSVLKVSILRDNKQVVIGAAGEAWAVTGLRQPVPKALWGTPHPDGKTPESEATRADYCTGVHIAVPVPRPTTSTLLRTTAQATGYETLTDGPLALSGKAKACGPSRETPKDPMAVIGQIADTSVRTARKGILTALPDSLRPKDADDAMTAYASCAGQYLGAEPVIVSGWKAGL